MGSGGIDPLALNLGTRWRWMVSFTSQPLYSQGRSGCVRKKKRNTSYAPAGNRTLVVQPVVSCDTGGNPDCELYDMATLR